MSREPKGWQAIWFLVAGVALGAASGVAWERARQPFERIGHTLRLPGSQSLVLRDVDGSVVLDGAGAVRLEGADGTAELSTEEGGAALRLRGPDQEAITLVAGNDRVQLEGATRFHRISLTLDDALPAPLIEWTGQDGVLRSRCILGPTALDCTPTSLD
ncbi:MAG: hypothetical protein KC656_32005 [Myxococcales bacterium]|nr:hypothetical protein [Myxococcales bacterium]